MCSIDSHFMMHTTGNDDASSVGVRSIPPGSTEDVLVSLGITLKFIYSWIQSFKTNYLHQTTVYCDKMRDLFKNIPVIIP